MAKPLALTSGEPAGIGPDITLKAWLRRKELKLPAFYLLGDREFLARRASSLGTAPASRWLIAATVAAVRSAGGPAGIGVARSSPVA